ncbi:hypothetical protein WJR50_06335 [Catalinimonas sp. 4WD22]|uniref:hypothetical protein n=1 Tax=Catalinimonas locisalis TaxID=3133978 RepID=UPI003100AA23
MKTSNKLILTLIAVIFLGILSSSLILKSEFEKLDRNDPLSGYSQGELPPFKAVKIIGNYPGLVELRAGDAYEIRMDEGTDGRTKWEIKGDTLEVSIQLMNPSENFPKYYYTFYGENAGVYITAPNLSALHAEGITCRLSGWKEAQMHFEVQGKEGVQRGVLLKESNVDQFSATVSEGSLLLLEASNKISRALVNIRDVSAFTAEYNALDSLEIQADETAQLNLPGYLLSRLIP